jgi:hypothetical protein
VSPEDSVAPPLQLALLQLAMKAAAKEEEEREYQQQREARHKAWHNQQSEKEAQMREDKVLLLCYLPVLLAILP